MKTFKYVYIPADEAAAIEERSMTYPENKEIECLVEGLKKHFSGRGELDTPEKIAGFREQVVQQLPKGTQVTEQMLNALLKMDGLVDCVPLLLNKKESNFVGVNVYVDDRASMKGLPENRRATELAMKCGKQIRIIGDAFIARSFDNDDDFKRLDFTVDELDGKRDWVKLARELNAAVEKEGDSSSDLLARMGKKPPASASKQCYKPSCTKNGTYQCSRCKVAKYCSQDCQKEDWRRHKKLCSASAAPSSRSS